MSLPVGSRLCVEKCKATVRYVGRIEGQQGTWVGLDWDDAGRGKHDGSTGGHRYFTCSGSAEPAPITATCGSQGCCRLQSLAPVSRQQLREGVFCLPAHTYMLKPSTS